MENKKKIIFNTVVITIILEVIIGIVLLLILYFNYDKLTAATSGVSEGIVNMEIKDISLDLEVSENTGEKKYYSGAFGKIEIVEESNIEDNNYKYHKNIICDVDTTSLNNQLILKTLFDYNVLDKHVYNELITDELSIKDLDELLSFEVLLGNIDTKTVDKIVKQITTKQSEITKKLIPLIKLHKCEDISEYLFNFEKDYAINTAKLTNTNFKSDSIINNEDFQYIVSKLYTSPYYDNIKKVSEELGIDERLIIAAIGVEQLRFLTTDRGNIKNVLKQNSLLTNFNKFSHGLGGIKVNTFKKINFDLKQYNEELYDKYFKLYDDMAKTEDNIYSDSLIQQILEDEYSGVLYVTGLLIAIKEKWSDAGYPIDNRPGIIITLYNMGNDKTPHATPDVGGSKIYVDEKWTYYFGEIGLIIYYYLKIYL